MGCEGRWEGAGLLRVLRASLGGEGLEGDTSTSTQSIFIFFNP